MTKSLLRRDISSGVSAEINTDIESEKSTAEEQILEAATRQGDSGVGRPRPQAIPVSKDSLTINNTPVNHEQEFIPEDELLAGSFFLPSALSKSLRIIFLCISAFAAFLLITQTASFLANIRQLSLLEKIILSAPLAAFGCVIIWIVVKLIILANRLRVSPKIKIKALEELEKRRNLRTLSLKKNRQAVEELASYLQHDFSIRQEMLSSWGIKELVITNLEKSRQELIQTASKPTGTSRDWIVDFEHNIQDKLDEIAQKRIFKYSTNAAVMAGISPFPLIDRLIVLSSSLGMLKELLELYSLKPTWDKNLILMAQVIISTYCAGVVGDITDSTFDNIADLAGEATSQIPDIALRVAGKSTESAIQGFMVYRLGKTALKIVHPIKK